MENYQSEKYKKALRRVDMQKKFYKHVMVYIVINIVLVAIKIKLFHGVIHENTWGEGFSDWLAWNFLATPLFWGLGLVFHGLYVFLLKGKPLKEFKPKRLKEWEERQIQKYMEQDNH
ncbi:2TM domain-containing protein [Spongiimicrobium sp. 3-5]|uniref:2TM domain-containing protein n=1 Tax=Spongiimicrobium sp. 3-5 TaxID=3332596 RepID=UPI00397F66E4